ncbi:MAG: VOC family protein [Demequinaceae bacterium]|nr:VOC family protein [Demequinaceae bacterium]
MQRLSLISLIVDDLPGAITFYGDAFGWKPHTRHDSLVFYQGNGFVLGLMTPSGWEEEATGQPRPGPACVAINLPSPEEVDTAVAQAVSAGATLVKDPVTVSWGGYSGYVTDPWNNLIEIAHNPDWPITADGRTLLPPLEGS